MKAAKDAAERRAHKTRLPRPKGNAITVRDVAKTAGVSVATVSRVLNGNSTVAADLRKKVIRVAARSPTIFSTWATPNSA